MWKYNQDNTRSSSFYIKGLKGLEYDIPEVKGIGIKIKNHLPRKTEYNTSGEKWSFIEIEDFQAFLMKRLELNRKFDFQTQESREA